MKTLRFHKSNETIAVGKILCLGRNFAAHAREMNSNPPTSPVVFLKPASALVGNGGTIIRPSFSRELHHEVEMVVVIGRQGKHIPLAEAFDYVAGYGVGLDMTLRDVQSEAKKNGLPWTIAKGFDTSAAISEIESPENVQDPHALDISLKVNGQVRQKSNTSQMIFPIDSTLSYLSTIFTLERGDLVYMGTPEGVSEVLPGDALEAELEGVATLRVSVGEEVRE